MNRRLTLNLVLGTALLVVWGTIALRLVEAANGDSGAGAESAVVPTGPRSPYVYTADVRDPFTGFQKRPARKPPDSLSTHTRKSPWTPPPFRLSGTLLRTGRRMAILEGEGGEVYYLAERDTLSGVRIIKVYQDSVRFAYNGRRALWAIAR